MKKTAKILTLLLTVVTILALTACGKNNNGNNTTPTTAANNQPQQRKIVRLKSYPDSPAEGTEMHDSWHVTSCFETFEFNDKGELTGHTVECIIDDAKNYETVNNALTASGSTVSWNEGNGSFVLSYSNETKTPDEAVNYLKGLKTGFIVFYDDGNSVTYD